MVSDGKGTVNIDININAETLGEKLSGSWAMLEALEAAKDKAKLSMLKGKSMAPTLKPAKLTAKGGPIIGEEIDMMIVDELDNADELTVEDFAAEINRYIKDVEQPPTGFMLLEPSSLTIKKKDGTYSKRPHIGGENFKLTHSYVGKRGSLIFVFIPLEVTDFSEMEMSEKEALKKMSGFNGYIGGAMSGDLKRAMNDAKKKSADEQERQKNAAKFNDYDTWGSF